MTHALLVDDDAELRMLVAALFGPLADGATLETPTITGSVSAGYAIALTVGIAA
jgi:hypothetical protein